ncbi:MAG: transposase [Firmicutes bacterium]|nr:transposase [Bacillota bacterium]
MAASAAEKDRIRRTRQDQNDRMRAEGRTQRTTDERNALRPRLWVAQSPTLVHQPDGFWLHVPFEKWVAVAGTAEEQRIHNPCLRVGTVDLNADSAVAAAWEGQSCQGVKTVWHARENAKREKALQKVARKQRQAGKPVKGEHSNRFLWEYIRNLDNTTAWQVASAIVAWAVATGISVLVFEYLRSYRPKRGLSWSRRTNRKRTYWLRGQVLRHVRDLALREGMLVVERNPAWTSQVCPQCSHLGERFSPDGHGYPSRFHCGHCGWTGDANVVAAFNLKKKWDRSFRYPTPDERQAADLRSARKGGAAAKSKGLPVAG